MEKFINNNEIINIDLLLDEMYKKDIEVREKIREYFKENEIHQGVVPFSNEMRKIDQNNLDNLKGLVKKFGWNKLLKKKENLQKVWQLVQHADRDYFIQIDFLDFIQKNNIIDSLEEKGKKEMISNLSMLEDRILVYSGQLQKYGSQFWVNPETGKYESRPIMLEEKKIEWDNILY